MWRNDGDAAHAQTLVTQDMDDMMTAYEYLAGVFNTVLKVGVGACGGKEMERILKMIYVYLRIIEHSFPYFLVEKSLQSRNKAFYI